MSERDHDRRGFLRVGGSSVGLVLLACAGCEEGGLSEPSGPIAAGNVSDLMVDTLRVVNGPLVLARDGAGLYAMSGVCPHAGCPVGTAGASLAQGLVCHCHGSVFDGQGAVTRGPARTSLRHYPVEVDGSGAITIRADRPPVADDVRTAVTPT
jgi:Rieske Fe-S protein